MCRTLTIGRSDELELARSVKKRREGKKLLGIICASRTLRKLILGMEPVYWFRALDTLVTK